MKHITFLDTDKRSYKSVKKEAKRSAYSALLIQLFFGYSKKATIEKELKRLRRDFPDAVIIGATTAGEISHASMHTKSLVLSFSFFKKTQLHTAYTKKITYNSGLKLAKKLFQKDTKASIVLSEGLLGKDYEHFLIGLKDVNSEVVIAGGLAGDNFALKKTYVCLDDNVYEEGAVAVSFSSKKLFASSAYNLNWTPIGKEFTITKVQHNRVQEIDHIPALEFFEKYLGKELLHANKLALPNFQLLFKEEDTVVARTPLQIIGNEIVLAGPIIEGQVVQFGFSNESSVVDAAHTLGEELSKKPAEGIYIFSCIARKTLLGKTLEKEFSSFESIAPTAGFFTYGEFYSSNQKSVLLNCTTTVLILSESKRRKSIKEYTNQTKTLDTITFDALTHFIKQTSLELKQNIRLMNQYKETVDTSALVSKTDKRGYITYVNDLFCKVSQYKEEELIGQNHNIIRDPNVSSFVFKKMWQTILAKKVWRGSFSNRAKDGSLYYVDATIMPILDEDGEIEEFIAVRQDVTKQVIAKNRMKEKEKLIRAIFDNQDSIVIHASKRFGMQSVNKKLFEYFDFKNFEDFKSRHKCICDLFLEEEGYVNVEQYPNWLDDIASDEEHDYKVKMRTKTGKIHTFTIKAKRINDEYIINLYDITKLEEALLRAYSSEKAKTIFLANMSHEIRTPLNGILGFTDLLTKKELDKDAKRYVDIIHKSGETLLAVVNDILDFSKLESGELELYKGEVNLFEEMEAAVSTFASLSKKKKINYYVYIDTSLPKIVLCDIQRLKQVMNNLISNAIKFTPENGEVFVRVELIGLKDLKADIHFSVKDSGIGIAKEKAATVFEAFSQADNSISREFGGTGLGLAISNQYIKMMGSRIELESELSKGSCFSFELELDVVDPSHSVEKGSFEATNTIAIMNSYKGISCGINEIVYTYLDAWNYHYKEINTVDELDDTIDILIVCSKLFDEHHCREILSVYPNINLVYIEGAENRIECSNEKFHFIEQPMTGSALFDKLISLMDPLLSKELDAELPNNTPLQKYNAKVLVAEDNETNQMLISIMLDERGIEHKIVPNGLELLDEVAKNDLYDLIFMDINMPLLDGIETTKRLRAKAYSKPIVSLSANVIESDTKAFKEAGMDDTLNKPIIPKELDSILQKYLTKVVVVERGNDFDIVDIEIIAKKLSLSDTTMVKRLLKSLAKTFEKALVELETPREKYDDILHRLKGAAGNMRFEKLYKLLQNMEKEFSRTSLKELKAHLKNALHQIEKLV